MNFIHTLEIISLAIIRLTMKMSFRYPLLQAPTKTCFKNKYSANVPMKEQMAAITFEIKKKKMAVTLPGIKRSKL